MPLENVIIVGLDVSPNNVRLNGNLVPFAFSRSQLTLQNLNLDLKSNIEVTWQ